MKLQHAKFLSLIGFILLVALGSNNTQASSPNFTLPFDDPDVFLRQGWLYDSPGPFACPQSEGGDRCHKGLDYFKGSPGAWQPFDVLATAGGWAIAANDTNYGLFILIAHDQTDSNGERYFTLYAHLADKEVKIPLMQKNSMRIDASTDNFSSWVRVNRGEKIGVTGSSGAVTNVVHLHLEVQRGGYALNKTDPYDIYSDFTAYGSDCGIEHLWSQCPPTSYDLPIPPTPGSCATDQAVPDPRGIFGEIGYHQILAFQPTGQEFVPTQSEHLEISLFLGNINTNSTIAPVTLSIRPITIFGPAVATSTVTPAALLLGESDWVTFDLSNEPGRFLTPGQTYVIDVATTTDRWMWWNIYEDPSLYPNGRWVLYGEPVADGSSGSGTDFVFRTCTKQPSQTSSCGNGICESGEDFVSCSADCVVIFGAF